MKVKTDVSQKIQYLFYTPKCMQKILLENSELLIMNCTYKINRYKMPLLIITGVTNLNTYFYVTFCFLKSEHIEDFVWALEAVRALYIKLGLSSSEVIITDGDKAISGALHQVFGSTTKHLLCIWHLEKNIAENCSQYFEIKEDMEAFMKDFKQLFYIATEAELKQRYNELYSTWRDIDINIVRYLDDNIWKWRRKWAKCYTDKALHFGNIVTSRSEGDHSSVKDRLQFSTGMPSYYVLRILLGF